MVGAKPRKTIKLPDEKVNRKDYTKKCVSRSLSNPCTYDYNMRSTGAPSHVKNQLTFTGGIASFIGEPEQSFRRVTTNPTLSTGRKDCLNKSLDLTSQSKVASKMVDLGKRENITMSARPFNELLNKKVTYSGNNKNEMMQEDELKRTEKKLTPFLIQLEVNFLQPNNNSILHFRTEQLSAWSFFLQCASFLEQLEFFSTFLFSADNFHSISLFHGDKNSAS